MTKETQHRASNLGRAGGPIARARELDPSVSEARASRANFALLRYQVHGDVEGLRAGDRGATQRAIELDPSKCAEAHY